MTVTTETTGVRGAAVLANGLAGSGPWRVWGVAIGPDEVTVGMSGQKKFWPGDALKDAADTLTGKNLVKNHVNDDVDAVVGAVTEARYHPQYGVLFKGEVDDEDLARKIKRERLDVSPRIIHSHIDELETNDEGALVVDNIKEFVNLAMVPRGAAESNKIQIGETGLLSQADLREELGADDPEQDDELEIEERVETGEESVGFEELTDWDVDELQDLSVHKPSYSGTTESDWSKPSLEDFDTDDLSEIADHFIVSKNGFPPDSFGDLSLPVVEPDGTLNKNGVDSARKMAGKVDGLSGDDLDRVKSIISDLPGGDDDDEEENADAEAETNETAVLGELDFLGVPEETEVDITKIDILN